MTINTAKFQCERIRGYRRLVVALFVLFIPVVFPLGVALYKLLHTFFFSFVLAGIWAAAYLVIGVLLAFSLCLNCNQRFVKWWVLTKKCAHCGFRC